MWLMSFIPGNMLEIIIYVIITVGLFATAISLLFVDMLPRITPGIVAYNKIIQIVSIGVLSFGIYLQGAYSTEMVWQQKVTELEQKLQIAEEKSAVVNSNLEKKVVNNNNIIHRKANKTIEYIDREIIKYNNQCYIPQEVISVLNDAASMGHLYSEENSK